MNKIKDKYYILINLLLPVLFLLSCENNVSSPVIARVGKSILTINDLNKSIPPEYNNAITHEQNINYVKQWIHTELLYKEAIQRKIDSEQQMKNRLKEMKKNLLAAEMINRYSTLNESSTIIDDNTINEYYSKHKEEFIRENDVAKYLEVIVDDQKTAWHIIRNADSDNFLEFASNYSKLPVSDLSYVPYIALNNIPPDIAQAISSCRINGITKPISSEMGYHVILVLDKLEKGGICLQEEVRDEIINRLSTKMQKQSLENLLSELRLKTDVEFNVDLIPGNRNENIRDSLTNKQENKEN
jgi:parvulin-like peptidyl-prolyl isomerase